MSDFKKQYLPVAMAAAQKYGLDPVMFAAQIEQESGWNPAAKSRAGARGIAQFMPATAKEMGVNPLDPVAALDASARYMAQLKDRFGNEDLARQAYNAGMGTLSKVLAGKAKLPKETADYNNLIAKRASKLQTEVAGGTPASTLDMAPTPASAAGEPAARRRTASVEDAARVALAEMGTGVPVAEMAAQPPEMPAQDWRAALSGLSAPIPTAPVPQGEFNLDALSEIQDMAAKAQDATLAQMFGDMLPQRREDTSLLPSSVDRYLDKLLA